MKKALVSPIEPVETGYRICEVADFVFEIAAPLFWVDVADDVSPSKNYYDPATQTVMGIPSEDPYTVAVDDARRQRDGLLLGTDFTQLPDSPYTTEQRTAWAAYRDQLRNVTAQPGFPFEIVWPEPPMPYPYMS